MKETCLVLDARAAFVDEFKDSSIVLSGDAKECCDTANRGDYGEGCVVYSCDDGEIMWEWFHTGKWIPTTNT